MYENLYQLRKRISDNEIKLKIILANNIVKDETDEDIMKEIKTEEVETKFLKLEDNFLSKPITFQCEICGLMVSSEQNSAQVHMSEHNRIRQYTCNLCNKIFRRLEYLNNHMKIHAGSF